MTGSDKVITAPFDGDAAERCEQQPPSAIKFNASLSFYCARRMCYIYAYIHTYIQAAEIENGRLLSVRAGRRVLKYSDEEASNLELRLHRGTNRVAGL